MVYTCISVICHGLGVGKKNHYACTCIGSESAYILSKGSIYKDFILYGKGVLSSSVSSWQQLWSFMLEHNLHVLWMTKLIVLIDN